MCCSHLRCKHPAASAVLQVRYLYSGSAAEIFINLNENLQNINNSFMSARSLNSSQQLQCFCGKKIDFNSYAYSKMDGQNAMKIDEAQ